MTTEEKAKAYDEVLERVKPLYEWAKKDDSPMWSTYEYLFPQLAESEDERVRKTLIEALKTARTVGELKFILPEPTREECIAYLEKQKEPVVDKEGMYYYFGGKLIYCGYPATEENPYDFAMSQQEKQKEQKPWKVGANAYFTPEQKPVEWSDEDREAIDMCIDAIPKAWKTKSGTLLTKWLKEHVQVQTKDWSEEDEKALELVIDCIYEFYPDPVMKYKLKDWLNALRPQYHGDVTMTEAYKMGIEAGKASYWKPSEEQMYSLHDTIVQTKGYSYSMYLPELYEQLKKLM